MRRHWVFLSSFNYSEEHLGYRWQQWVGQKYHTQTYRPTLRPHRRTNLYRRDRYIHHSPYRPQTRHICAFPRLHAISRFCMYLTSRLSTRFADWIHGTQVRDNIAFGDPYHTADFDKIERAAQLGGADAFIEKLPDKYEEYLHRPSAAQDQYSSLPEGTTTLFGRPVDLGSVRGAFRGGSSTSRGLSGGQQQRIAL